MYQNEFVKIYRDPLPLMFIVEGIEQSRKLYIEDEVLYINTDMSNFTFISTK